MLAGKGFKPVYNVAGGIKAWTAGTAVGAPDLGVHLFTGAESPEAVLKIAYSLEEGLRDFYLTMAGQADLAEVKQLFEKLSDIEIKHQDAIINAYRALGHETDRETFSGQVKAMEGGLTTREYLDLFQPDLSSPKEVVSLAMSIEAQALDLYYRAGTGFENPDARAATLKIADEEKVHLESLGKLMESLS